MLRAYDAKYRGMSPISPLKALTYYDDIREREPILTLRGNYDWSLIDYRLQDMLAHLSQTSQPSMRISHSHSPGAFPLFLFYAYVCPPKKSPIHMIYKRILLKLSG